MSDFVDRVIVHVRAGDGGNGSAGIRREKYKPLAGPNGGNGGCGGSVIFEANPNCTSLLDYRFMPHRKAENGTMGLGDTKDGSRGEDLILPVPVGTVVFAAPMLNNSDASALDNKSRTALQLSHHEKRATVKPLVDLCQPYQRFVAAKGGFGGLGNAALANKTRRAPGFALLGEPGEERDLILELKSIADVALVGFPSAGKSSLIASLSAAKPKIADYPFTTLVPNLGVVNIENTHYTIADVPGLIPGASQGKGLGLEFLRHIERTTVIVHVIDCATFETHRDPISDYHALENELQQYAQALDIPLGSIPIESRRRVIVLNKADIPDAYELAQMVLPEFEALNLPVFICSTASRQGLRELSFALGKIVSEEKARIAKMDQDAEQERVVINPLDSQLSSNYRFRVDQESFTITKHTHGNGDIWFLVRGEKPERWVKQTNFDNEEAVGYLADRLAKLGVEDRLRKLGAHIGDTICIGEGKYAVEFDWDPTITAGAELLDGSTLGAHGQDLRLSSAQQSRRRTNAERRQEYYETMDARAAVRKVMQEERKMGHWSDPSINDDPHDTEGLLGK